MMEYIIVTTNPIEQQEAMEYLGDKLKEMYLTDPSITIIKSGMSKIDIAHRVKEQYNLAARYRVVIVPVTMNMDKLEGMPFNSSININKLLARLDTLKAEAIGYVNRHRHMPEDAKLRNKALVDAVYDMFK